MSAPADVWPWTEAERDEADRRDRQIVRRMGICVHSRGTVVYDEPGYEANNICRAGVDFRTVMVREHEPVQMPDHGPGVRGFLLTYSVPCNDRLNGCGATCASRATPNRAEAVASVAAEFVRAEASR